MSNWKIKWQNFMIYNVKYIKYTLIRTALYFLGNIYKVLYNNLNPRGGGHQLVLCNKIIGVVRNLLSCTFIYPFS